MDMAKANQIMNRTITQIPGRIDAALRLPWQMRAMAIVDAVIANVVILIVGRLVTGEFPVATVGGDEQTIGFPQVILVTVLVGLVAWGLLALLERTTAHARMVWTMIAVVVVVLSLLGPIGSGANTSSTVVLACLHIGAAATIIPIMRRSASVHK